MAISFGLGPCLRVGKAPLARGPTSRVVDVPQWESSWMTSKLVLHEGDMVIGEGCVYLIEESMTATINEVARKCRKAFPGDIVVVGNHRCLIKK